MSKYKVEKDGCNFFAILHKITLNHVTACEVFCVLEIIAEMNHIK